MKFDAPTFLFSLLGGLVVVLLLFGIPSAFAADVNFSADTVLSFTSPSTSGVIKATSGVDTLVIGTTSTVITATAGTSTSTIESIHTNFTISGNAHLGCVAGDIARVTITDTGTVTITPTGNRCNFSLPGGGGGGGGGSASSPSTATTTATTTPTTVATTTSATSSLSAAPAASPQDQLAALQERLRQLRGMQAALMFQKNLRMGEVGNDVRSLQEYLIEKNAGPSAVALAKNGATGFFGSLTKRALVEYQASAGITATGFFGPTTREYVNRQSGAQATPAGLESSEAPVFSRNFGRNAQGEEVTTLQLFLIRKNVGPKAQALAEAGATGFFGGVTRAALAEYQESAGIQATGYLGPLTREFIRTH